MTDSHASGHFIAVLSSPELRSGRRGAEGSEGGQAAGMGGCQALAVSVSDVPQLDFAEVYQNYFDFVWRSLRRVGVPNDHLDDATQEVFLIVHRRLEDFEPGSSIKAWLFAIVQRIASQSRRSARRHPEEPLPPDLPASTNDPHEATVQAHALRLVYQALDALDEEKRAVFVLAELEQMTAPEIAQALSLKLNTVYSRLRAARHKFEAALSSSQRRATRSRP
jgi:RNA polymerase sigma-70 factor (ECF subfamily)